MLLTCNPKLPRSEPPAASHKFSFPFGYIQSIPQFVLPPSFSPTGNLRVSKVDGGFAFSFSPFLFAQRDCFPKRRLTDGKRGERQKRCRRRGRENGGKTNVFSFSPSVATPLPPQANKRVSSAPPSTGPTFPPCSARCRCDGHLCITLSYTQVSLSFAGKTTRKAS